MDLSEEERRAADQDAAIEAAFLAGTLPEADRRALEEQAAADRATEDAALLAAEEAVRPPEPVVEIPLEERVPVGSIIERQPHGWTVRLMYGGAIRLHGEGATIRDALTAVGL